MGDKQNILSSLDINSNENGEVVPNYTLTVTSNKYDLYKKIIVGLGSLCLLMLLLIAIFGGLYGDAHVKADKKEAIVESYKTPLDDLCLNNSHCFSAAAFHQTIMNQSADPCEDFYEYACGNWKYLPEAKLQPHDRELSVYSVLAEENEKRVLRILNDRFYNPSKEYEKKLKSYYITCMDTHERETLQGKPLLDHLKSKDSLGPWYVLDENMTGWDFEKALTAAHVKFYAPVLFDYNVVRDHVKGTNEQNNTEAAISISHGGLGATYMTYQYYLEPDNWGYKDTVRKAYKKFMQEIAEFFVRDAGLKLTRDVKERLETFLTDVYDFEVTLAKLYDSSAWNKDAYNDEERMNIHQLTYESPIIHWEELLRAAFGNIITDSYKIIVHEKEFIKKLSDLLITDDFKHKRQLNNYIAWRVMYGWVQDLSEDYRHSWRVFMSTFTYYNNDNNQQDDCYQRAVYAMGDAVGALFVRDHFQDHQKKYIDEIMDFLKMSLKEHVETGFTWMDDETRKVAMTKVASVIDKVGHPAALDPNNPGILNYIYDKFDANVMKTYWDNEMARVVWLNERNKQRLRSGIDENQWPITVPQVLAWYSRSWNDILVPAGILQMPLFGKELPHFFNFATMGSIIMHELIHSIDQIGAYYTPDGEIKYWWSEDSYTKYKEREQCMIDLYANQTAGPYDLFNRQVTVPINGYNGARVGMPEVAGLQLHYAHRAYHKYMKTLVEKEKRVPGIADTLDKQFYIVYGLTHCHSRGGYWAWRRAMYGGLPEDMNLNMAVGQNHHFLKTFKCSKESRLHKIYDFDNKQCNVFN